MRKIKNIRTANEALSVLQGESSVRNSWTIISALSRVLSLASDSKLSDEFWEQCKSPLDYLSKELGLTNIQIVVLAILIEKGESVSWRGLGEYLGCPRLSIMVYTDEIEELITKRWVVRRVAHEFTGNFEGFALAYGVVTALRHNQAFVPEKIDGLTEQQFVDKLCSHVEANKDEQRFCDGEEWMMQLIKANQHLPICQALQEFDDTHVKSLFLMFICDYADYAGTDRDGIKLNTISDLFDGCIDQIGICNSLRDGYHELIESGLIEFKCEDGMVNNEEYRLTDDAKRNLLSAYTPVKKHYRGEVTNRYVKKCSAIKEKPLFYNASERQQIQSLTSLLSQENLPSIQQRLEKEGLPKGFACLFYGDPGTGKTETVRQIARMTGRNLMQVDIAGLRDKYVGESEKNIKEIFTRYRSLCKNSEVMPILFFNEADAIINKRNENVEQSVDKMDNAMQNIILQEIEDLDGILIATTNLTSNLDRAFERRFLYKVEFHKPEVEVKAQIWHAMLKDIGIEDARYLASRFDFSGGQIENIARKRTVDYILTGKYATLAEIESYCQSEQLANRKGCKRVNGFS